MTYAEPYVYLRVLGGFGTPATPLDEWNVGFKFRHPDAAPTSADLVEFLESAAPEIATFHAGAVSAGTISFITELTAAFIGTDGKYVGGGAQATTRHLYGTPAFGTGTARHPYSEALVLSLRTPLTRGPGSNGRLYWPSCALDVAANTGLVVDTVIATIASEAKTMLDALNDAKLSAMPGTGRLAVMSRVGSGVAANVTSVRVGRRKDRQERREKNLSEGYVSQTLASAAAELAALREVRIGQ